MLLDTTFLIDLQQNVAGGGPRLDCDVADLAGSVSSPKKQTSRFFPRSKHPL